MQTYHSDPAIKAKYISRVRQHREADSLVQGTGWENGKGCAVGCTLEAYEHSRYPIELGIPEWLAHLEDHIFESLPDQEAVLWPEQFLSAIPEGIEESALQIVRDRFQIFWLNRQKTQIDCRRFPEVESVINNVIALLESAVTVDEPDSAARSAARSAAWSAARSEAVVKRDWLLCALKSLPTQAIC